MKIYSTIYILPFVFSTIAAAQIKGGWLSYEYQNPTFGTPTYKFNITIYIFYGKTPIPTISLPPIPGVNSIGIWDAITGEPVANQSHVGSGNSVGLSNTFNECSNSPFFANFYKVSRLDSEIVVPINKNGYLVGITKYGRDPENVNIYDAPNSSILFFSTIPGVINGVDYHRNNNPYFNFMDTVTVCKGQPFSFSSAATDFDKDSLSYSFGDAIQGAFDSTSPPITRSVFYNGPYTGADALGTGITIDPITGIVSGIAPDMPGGYVIAVYVQEWRKGVLINTTKKESQIKVTDCPFVKPLLKPLYSSCRVNTFNFRNEPTCPTITKWLWDFGDTTTIADTSNSATPTYTYPGSGTYKLKLTVANNYGYLDSATSVVKIFDSITVKINPDTAICATDTITLKPVSDAVNYVWRESGAGNTLSGYNIKIPKAFPKIFSTTYFIKGSLDNCYDSAKIIVHASPYPKAKLGADTVICFGQKAILNGTISGAFFTWNPTSSLSNPNSLQPIASPIKTTAYILTARDTFYCPKTVSDTEIVKVVPIFSVDAGQDVSVVAGQPYQLFATPKNNTEIVRYNWQPSQYLNNGTEQNPYATILNGMSDSVKFTVTAITVLGNCTATDDVVLRVYKIGPDIILPTGFTPNGDGKNDVLKPILIGIKQFDYFKVYNRFGQLLFTTSDAGKGWDGYINGEPQQAGTYVVMAHGIDYLGRDILKKETVVLIR